jgi:hypothetical protein
VRNRLLFIGVIRVRVTEKTCSLAFFIYNLTIWFIKIYATSGQNAPSAESRQGGAIELTGRPAVRKDYEDYERVPMTALSGDTHVVGDDD